jgi:hypothetical protein
VAREKVSQCLRDITKVVSKPKLGGQGEDQRGLTSEAILNGIELDEAKEFVRLSTTAVASQLSELDGGSSSAAPVLKRSRSYPDSDPEADRQSLLKRPRQYASLSELGKETFGAYSYRNTTFSDHLPFGDPSFELPHGSYSLNNCVSESRSNGKQSDEEYAFENQAISRADQLKSDDSALHRLIDRTILEEQI